jgi:hypothetical protein
MKLSFIGKDLNLGELISGKIVDNVKNILTNLLEHVTLITLTKEEKNNGELFNKEISVNIPTQDFELDGDDDSPIEKVS